MGLFRSGRVLGIAAETLEFILEASAESHPDEYMALLRGTPASRLDLHEDGVVVTDVLVIPGTRSNPVSATVKTNMVPNGMRALGSVHSHPNGVLQPSDQDLATFHVGKVHLIVGSPYDRESWRAFDPEGNPRDLEVLSVPVPDDESFFDFTQADIDAEL